MAPVAAPAPLTTTWTGLCRPNSLQPRLSNDWSNRFAMNVYSVSPTVGTGDGATASAAWLAARNGVWIFTRFWQNIAGLLLALVWLSTGASPISDRYRSVLARLGEAPGPCPISSFSGIRAACAGWFLAASSSSRAWDVAILPPLSRLGASNGVQP